MSFSRLGFRTASAFRQPAARFTQRRWQSTAEAAAPSNESAFAKLLNSPVGPKTVHFWAPIMKWGVVLAGASDFARPASQLSISQNFALTCTGAIWTRWCFIIKPQNLFLASVNFCLFLVGITQVSRAVAYQQSLKGKGVEATGTEGKLEKIARDPVEGVKEAVGAK